MQAWRSHVETFSTQRSVTLCFIVAPILRYCYTSVPGLGRSAELFVASVLLGPVVKVAVNGRCQRSRLRRAAFTMPVFALIHFVSFVRGCCL